MISCKIINRVLNVSTEQTQTIFRCLQRNCKSTKVLSYEESRVENDAVHKTLECLEVYQNHALPSPKICQEFLNSKVYTSNSGSCNCTIKCRLSKMPRTEFVESGPKNVISASDILFKQDRNFVQECEQFSPHLPLVENSVEYFKWPNFEKRFLAQDIDNPKSIDALIKNLELVSNIELTQIMIHMSLWPFKQEEYFALLTNVLDIECCKRYLQWPVEHQFYIADLWYHLNMSRICRFNSEIIQKMSGILNDLTNCQLIHLLFLISLRRKVNSNLMSEIEKFLEIKIDSFSAEEIVIIAMAYFKTSTKITSHIIILRMINELNKSFADMNLVQLICVVKALRYSYRFENRQLIAEFLRTAANNSIWGNNFAPAAHLCLLARSHNIYVPELLDKVIKDMVKDTVDYEDIRLKDIAKVLMTASKFNHTHPNVLNSLSEFCRKQFSCQGRQQEIRDFYQHYISSLLSLSYMGIFVHDQLHQAFNNLSPELSHHFSRDLAVLDCIVEIDEPLYTGNRLSVEVRHEILRKFYLYYPTSIVTKTLRERITMDLRTVLEELFSKEVSMVHVLPYMVEPVFLLVFDGVGQLHEPTEDFMSLVSKGCITKPTNEHNWVVIWPITKKEMFSSVHFTGLSLVKERHFNKLGFKLIKIRGDLSSNHDQCKRFLLESLKCFLHNS